ncbi:hypothetical protein A3K86_18110 [Photobacterium jeanii]|uniref:Uncharacterized protein n=1 Tax=Photobacterium jeanii TaxID=858640 RepID=A0A178K2E0_9GAMM|nr:efflux RND transporter periplasmic adaptor subunit [Photobacterium jeanii]OAN10904.1 hypothetical protein A3K86_18110 [Photobacterium jeanii]
MRTSAKALVVLMPLLLAACNESIIPSASAEVTMAAPSPQVKVLPLALQETSLSEQFVGKTQAVDKVDIVPKVSGYITERLFTEGEMVKKGEVLFRIDPVPYQIEVQRLEAMVEQADAQFQISDKTYRKAKKLVAKAALTQIELEQLEAERKELAAQVKAAKADLERAKLELSYTKVTAPFDGVVGASRVSTGSLVGPESAALTRLVSYDNMYVSIKLNEKQYLNDLQDKMQRGEAITAPDIRLQLANGTVYRHQGEVNFVDNQVDGSNGTITFRIKFPNPEALLVPGQFVTLTTTNSQGEQKIVIPQSAVQEDQAGRFVMVANQQDLAEQRYLTLGQRLGKNWVVENGLQDGERLIVEGLQQVRAGQPIEVIQ